MATIKEKAQAYEPKQIKTVADLEIFDLSLEVKEDKDAEFPYKYVMKDGERYKVPLTVLKSIKAFTEEKPLLKFVKVKKSGEGKKTEYVTMPVD